jgi:hypothetical protein
MNLFENFFESFVVGWCKKISIGNKDGERLGLVVGVVGELIAIVSNFLSSLNKASFISWFDLMR